MAAPAGFMRSGSEGAAVRARHSGLSLWTTAACIIAPAPASSAHGKCVAAGSAISTDRHVADSSALAIQVGELIL